MNQQQPFYDPNNPQESPNSKYEKVNAIWKIVVLIYVLGALGLIFYWEAMDAGLCMMVREWQGYLISDGYYPALDILLSLLMMLVPLFVAKFIVEKVTGVKIDGYKK